MKYTFSFLFYRHLVLLILVGISSELYGTHVEALWSGALTPQSIRVNAKISDAASVRLALSTDAYDFRSPIFSDYVLAKGEQDYMVSLFMTNLSPNTTYYYRIELNGGLDNSDDAKGRFHTPKEGPFSFSFAFGSCMGGGSNREVFETIANEDLLFFLHTGDMHYRNIDSDCENNFRGAYSDILGSYRQGLMYRSIPMAYMWDDHDFGPNDSDGSAPCKETAREFYQRYVPHYPLAAGNGNVPISQSFVVGRVRFILSDLRSEKRKPEFEPSSCDVARPGTNFGPQLSWFKSELLKAKENGQLAVWVSGIPYLNGPGGPNYHCKEDDDWGGYPEERQEIANYIKANEIPIVIVGGDSHMTAIDDGSHSDYATGGGAPIPVFHGGSLDRGGSYKGGPYSHGYKKDGGQFGLFSVNDDGTNVLQLSWKGMNEDGDVLISQDQGKEIAYDFKVELSDPVTFPVDFLGLGVRQAIGGIQLDWETANEINLAYYAVERSLDQSIYERIGQVEAGKASYQFTDDQFGIGRAYYRIKAIDLDGSITLSEVKSIQVEPIKLGMNLYPNPNGGQFQLEILSSEKVVEVFVHDMQGRIVKSSRVEMEGLRKKLDMNLTQFPPQLYIISILSGDNRVSERMIVN